MIIRKGYFDIPRSKLGPSGPILTFLVPIIMYFSCLIAIRGTWPMGHKTVNYTQFIRYRLPDTGRV